MYNRIEAYTRTPIGILKRIGKEVLVMKPFRKRLMEPLEHLLELGGIRKDITLLVLSGIAVVLSLAGVQPLPFDIAWAAIILCGVPIILEAIIGLVTEFDIKADVLVSLALIASVCIGETFAAGEVAFIMQLGGLLEELTVAKARAGIEKLVHLTPQTARVLKNGTETVVPAEQVQVGDVLRVLPGETVPVDGIITAGQTSINQAVMTGESLPVDKTVGDEVSSGTVNQFGAFEMRAAKVGEDSSIQRMIRLVQSADAGKAIVRCCKRDLGAELTAAQDFRMIPGRGVAATVEGAQLLAGNPELFKSEGVDFAVPASAEAHLQQGATITYLAVNGVFAGYIALSDTLRAESADTIRQLTALGVQPVLLTGDHASAANAIAGQLGIRGVRANCLPQDKLRCIDEFQQKGEPVCMIGDGINDAPALKKANVGIAMGGVGSDIAVDAADIALVDDEVKELPHLMALSQRMMTTIKLNLTFSMTLNFIAITLAITGILNPVVGALVHNAGSVLVIINSALLLNWRKNA